MPPTAAPSPHLHAIIGTSIPPIQVMDIGAMLEGDERYRALIDQGLASVTGFEANPAEFARLSRRTGPYTYHPVCLGNGNPATLHITHYPGCSSLLRPDETVINAFSGIGASLPGGNFAVEKTVPVDTVRLDDVEGCARPDLIKIDVQGGELGVVLGAADTLRRCRPVVVVEQKGFDARRGDKKHAALKFLNKMGARTFFVSSGDYSLDWPTGE